MLFDVDHNSSKPVYLQLIDQIKFAVASERLRAGDRLPAIRDLAVDLRINRNTIARVYSELEREGLLYTRVGQGCFISDRGSSLRRAEQRKQIVSRLDEVIAQARLFAIPKDQLSGIFEQRLEAVYPTEDETKGAKTR